MKIAIVAESMTRDRQRLQPQRTLIEMGRQLELAGHDIVHVSDGVAGPDEAPFSDLPIRHVRTVRKHTRSGNRELIEALGSEGPEVILWHVSLAGLLHQDPRLPFASHPIAVVTSPVQPAGQILRLGPRKLASNLDLVGVQLAGSMVPAALVRRNVTSGGWSALVTLSRSTRAHLMSMGVQAGSISVVPPGVGPRWLRHSVSDAERAELRARLGFAPSDMVATYFGSPAPVRGIFTFLRAVEVVVRNEPRLRVMILSRRTPDQWTRQSERLRWWAARPSLSGVVRLDDGFLKESDLIERLVVSDVVFLPFEVVPSDVPLSILEAMALGKCVVATRIGSLPELVQEDRGILVQPGSERQLAEALRVALASPDELAARGRRARSFVSRHRTWDRMGASLEHALGTLREPDAATR